MNTTDLKIFAMYYVMEHDNLLKEEKIAVMEFIKDNSEDHVKHLLLTGEVKYELVKEDLDFIKEGITDNWPNVVSARNYGRVHGALAAVLVAAAAFAAAKAYKRYFTKAGKTCAGKKGIEKKKCIMQVKQKAQQEKLKQLQSALSSGCPKSKDPASCKQKLQSKISKEKAKMGMLGESIEYIEEENFLNEKLWPWVRAGYEQGLTQGAAAVAVAGLAGVIGAKVYKRYLSQAAKACSGKAGDAKTNCMQKFKLDAIKSKIQAMEAGKSHCKTTSNPEKCVSKLQQKIAQEKAKLGQ